ncbi:uncharacterized protein BX664DRAFT_317435 [Halteromyces radiatus]|uniref:uncharacterized protein n=1 Tax=Halteromyces radiatus TaxID=101107 RepID=UPI00221EFF00|nr:uncharacterized protein BX664DRAFT_317435 [Halteromyces radiatus]KAI8081563.1 hypothetical protein BX664DRAFT_317435 [Halteromyces radiatus]
MKVLPIATLWWMLLNTFYIYAYPVFDDIILDVGSWNTLTITSTESLSSSPSTSNNLHPTISSSSTLPSSSSSSSSSDQSSGYPIYGDNHIITIQMGVLGSVFIVLGLYLVTFGFRGFRITLAVFGFLAFGFVTWVGMTNYQPSSGYINDKVTTIVVPAGLGLFGAILFFIFWNIGFYLIGAVGGLALALYICCWREDLVIQSLVARACFLAAMTVGFAGLTFFLERYVILFSTSFLGAYLFFVGVDVLARTGYVAGIRTIVDHNPLHSVQYVLSRDVYLLLSFTIVLFLISFGWQALMNRGRYFGIRYTHHEDIKAPVAAEVATEATDSHPSSHHNSRNGSPVHSPDTAEKHEQDTADHHSHPGSH